MNESTMIDLRAATGDVPSIEEYVGAALADLQRPTPAAAPRLRQRTAPRCGAVVFKDCRSPLMVKSWR
jgi:hypothetical protein